MTKGIMASGNSPLLDRSSRCFSAMAGEIINMFAGTKRKQQLQDIPDYLSELSRTLLLDNLASSSGFESRDVGTSIRIKITFASWREINY